MNITQHLKKQIKATANVAYNGYLYKVAGGALVLSAHPWAAWAAEVSGDKLDSIDWPWTKFLNSLAQQFTGPLPLTLGVLGIVGAGFALFGGHGGGGTQKFITLIFAISICLFAPNFVDLISSSAGGVTIYGV